MKRVILNTQCLFSSNFRSEVPNSNTSILKIFLLLVFSLILFNTQAQGLYYPKQTLIDPNFNEQFNSFGRKMEIGGLGGNKMIIAASGDTSQSPQVGAVYLYEFEGGSWVFKRSFRPENGDPTASYGIDISIAPNNNVFSVASLDGLYIYRFDTFSLQWVETFIDVPGFSTAVSDGLTFQSGFFNGVRVAVGNPYSNGVNGYAAVYRYDSNSWILEQEFIGVGNSLTGFDMTWSGGELILCLPGANGNVGQVNLFRVTEVPGPPRIFYTNTQQTLLASDGVSGDQFGTWVESSEDGTLAIQSYKNNLKGAVYIYEDIGELPEQLNYTENEQLQLLPLEQDGNFGRGISFDQNNLIIGNETISVYVYDTETYELKNYIDNNLFDENHIELGNFGVEGFNGDILIWGFLSVQQATRVYVLAEAAPVPNNERVSLIDFYNNTDGANWITNTNWLSTEALRNWFGVSTDVINGVERVTGLSLPNNNLNGQIHFQINQLDYLTDLILSNNMLKDGIPDFTSNTNLSNLYISNNNYTFGDFEDEFTTYQSIENFFYTPQKQLDPKPNVLTTIGEEVSVAAEVSGNQNNYFWYKRNIDGGGSLVSNEETLELTIVSQADFGSYWLEVTNDIVLGLLLRTPNFTVGQSTISNPDYDSLLALYNSTNGDNWTINTNWLDTAKPLSEWYGLTLTNNRVSSLNLGNNNLTGTLPVEIGNFSELTYLGLWSNTITGTIPAEIGNLSKLTELDLSPNTFTGTIPSEIGNLTNLEILWLNQNGLTGTIPQSFQNLVNLQQLHLVGTSGLPASNSSYSGKFPDLTALPLFILDVRRNYFEFSDFADEFDTYVSNIQFFDFSPQFTRDAEQSITQAPGSTITLTLTDVEAPAIGLARETDNTYQWYKDDVVITSANDPSFIINNAQVTDSGVYYCEITNSILPDLVIVRAPITVVIDATLDVSTKDTDEISIYPIPAANWLTIKSYNLQDAKVKIFDINGRLIVSEILNGNSNSLNVEHLQSGTYILKIEDKHKVQIKRFVKQ